MYDGKLVMHVPVHFDLPGNNKFFSACKLWFYGNPICSCTNAGRETITAPIFPFMYFIVDSIRKKLWNNFNARWRKILNIMNSAPCN